MSSLKLGINEVDNKTYHADRNYLSSSVLKTIYKSLDEYKRYYLDGEEKPQPTNTAALEEGSLAHSMILEPHMVELDYHFYDGLIKSGPDWQKFKTATPAGKTIISRPQRLRVAELAEVYKALPEAVQLVEGCLVEHTICDTLLDVPVKIRCDGIKPEAGIIIDIKTTGYGADIDSFRMTINQLSYQLSAALYCQVAEKFYGRPFDFYFVVLSKRDKSCEVYKTSKATRHEGDRMVQTALTKFKRAKETGVWTESVENKEMQKGLKKGYEILDV